VRNWLTFFTRGPKRFIRRLGAGISIAGRGFLSGWRGEGLETIIRRKLPGLPPVTQRTLAMEMMRKGEIEVPAGKIAITEEDIIQTAIAKLPKDFIAEAVPWEITKIQRPSPWGEDFQYKVHFWYLDEYVDREGVVRQVELDDWLTVTSKKAISRSQVIAQALGVFYMGPDVEERYLRKFGVSGIAEVHEIRYEGKAPSFVTDFLRGFRGD